MKKGKLNAVQKPKLYYSKPKLTKKKKSEPKTQKEKYFEAMRKQNDSLRKLPKNDPHHLPTFEDSPEGMEKRKKFYTFSKDNKKLRRLQALGKKLRKKYLN